MERVVAKRTVAPLADFACSARGPLDLGSGVTICATHHEEIQRGLDDFLRRLRTEPKECFRTYLSPYEREEFKATRLCLVHDFEAPDYLGSCEKLSKAELLKVVTGMRVAHPTLVRPQLFIRWECREGRWDVAGVEKPGVHAYEVPGEWHGVFTATNLATLGSLLPALRQVYSGHSMDSFNRVVNALNFFEMGYRTNWSAVRFVMFTTSLESLVLPSDARNGRQFREGIAELLGSTARKRSEIESAHRAIHDTRSAIVHGKAVSLPQEKFNHLLLKAQDLGRKCLQRVLASPELLSLFCGPADALQESALCMFYQAGPGRRVVKGYL